jgi:putative colanic acid biosysnthesis UDP-glucose lipid carrier transferase
MNQKLITKYFLCQWFSGIFFCSIIFLILTKLKMGRIDTLVILHVAMMIISSLILYAQSNIYINKSKFDLVYKIFLQWTLVLASCVLILFFLKISHNFSRLVLFQLYFYGFIIQLISFFVVRRFFKLVPEMAEYSLVVGKNNFTNNFSHALSLRRNEHLIGYIDEISDMVHTPFHNVKSAEREQVNICSLKLLEDLHVSKIYLSHPQASFRRVLESYHRYSIYPVDVIWHLLIDEKDIDSSLIMMDGFPFIQMSASPNQSNPLFQIFKRALDLLGAALLIICLSPLLLLIAILIKISSSGPIIFKQNRHGLHGKEIVIYKFRSMFLHQSDLVIQAKKNDSRITPIGQFIRKTSIDELPQLWNVIQGSMSLVGPRPHPVEFNEYYGPSINQYMMRHRIKPGITGLAQVYGARGETDTTEKMLRRIKLDLEYINKQSIILDIKILFLTPFAIVSYKGH